jgi:hypothetical protein
MTRTLSCRLLMAGLTLALPLAALADKPGFCPPVQVGLRGAPPPQAPGFLSLPPPLWGQPLSEAQQDQAFAILHDAAPALYEQGKRLQQSDEGLRRMAESGALDEARLAGLAVANARAHRTVGAACARHAAHPGIVDVRAACSVQRKSRSMRAALALCLHHRRPQWRQSEEQTPLCRAVLCFAVFLT